MNRILALAVISFREGIRNRSVYGVALFALFMLGLNIAVAGFFMREVGKVTVDMNLSALSFAGLLLVFFVGLNLMAKDIDKKTIHLVLSKPISRVEYIWGKYLGIMLFVAVSMGLLLVFSSATVFLLESMYAKYFGGFQWSIFFIACLFIYLKVAVVSAIVIFFSTITTSSFVTLVFSICSYIVGETIEEVVFFLKTSVAAEELVLSDLFLDVIQVVSYLAPNFSVFDFKLEAAHGLAVETSRCLLAGGYGLIYISILLLLGSMIFRRREFV